MTTRDKDKKNRTKQLTVLICAVAALLHEATQFTQAIAAFLATF